MSNYGFPRRENYRQAVSTSTEGREFPLFLRNIKSVSNGLQGRLTVYLRGGNGLCYWLFTVDFSQR